MERKRRERINTSLNELARLLTEAQKVKTEGGKAAKLEKADILELTVKHLQSLQEPPRESCEAEENEKYREGFSECIRVVEKALKNSTSEELKKRLLTHLYGRLKALKASRKRRLAEEKQEEKENRISDTTDEPGIKNAESKKPSNEKCSFTLVPTELPDGGMAFVLTGNPQRLLKEWENLSLEARLMPPKEDKKIESSPTINAAFENPSPTFRNSHSTLKTTKADESTTSLSPPLTQSTLPQHSNAIPHPPPPISNQALHFESEDKTYHTLQPLNPQSPCCFSAGNPLRRSRPQTKTHCPPTPPPSPMDNEEGKTSPREALPGHLPCGGLGEDRLLQEIEVENEPFDLTVSRMWRPW